MPGNDVDPHLIRTVTGIEHYHGPVAPLRKRLIGQMNLDRHILCENESPVSSQSLEVPCAYRGGEQKKHSLLHNFSRFP
jgi:hypothetical protein